MKKIIYISIGLVLLATGAYFLFQRDSVQDQELVEDLGGELNWSAYFPKTVPEYVEGEIREIVEVDPEQSRFKDEVVATVEDTSREELDEYVEQLVKEGWLITYQSPEEKTFYTMSLSLEEYTMSITFNNEEGTLTLTTYNTEE
jgi:hypothetical protein